MLHRLICLCLLLPGFLLAQETDPVIGISDKNPNHIAFTNAVIHVSPGVKIERGTLLIHEGKVVEAGSEVNWPAGTEVRDLKGAHIYPAFVEMYSNYGLPTDLAKHPPLDDPTGGAGAWNKVLKPEFESAAYFRPNDQAASKMRKMGFAVVATHHRTGLARGTSTVVSLANESGRKVMLKANGCAHYSLQKGNRLREYPSSLMGTIALLRQQYLDLKWYRNNQGQVPVNLALEAMINNESLPQIIEAGDVQSALRADRLGDEFGVGFIIRGSGQEYQLPEAIRETEAWFLLPLNFPAALEVSDAFASQDVSLKDLKHWEMAPSNPAFFAAAELPFVLTASDLKKPGEFWTNLRLAGQRGISEAQALRALTQTPAEWLGVDHLTGDLELGKRADFLILSDSLFHPQAKLLETHIGGKRYRIDKPVGLDIRGVYDLNLNSQVFELTVKGKSPRWKGTVRLPGGGEVPATIAVKDRLISVRFSSSDDPYRGPIALSGKINFGSGLWDGKGQFPDGSWEPWSAIRKKKHPNKTDTAAVDTLMPLAQVTYPFGAFGWDSLPEAEDLLITNATVWTCAESGIMKKTDVLIREGKIAAIGTDLSVSRETQVIDGTGKHLTPGIVDEHSHIGISRGVNEGTQAISAEVRVGDVVRPDDINLYRQLSGGVTTAQLLHGSSNPIGGQSALIKLKWGRSDQEMLIPDADGFIKFALGENVKRSNWGKRSSRYPQSRMGVEQVMYDAFYRAQAYREKQAAGYERIDLELEALAEIMEEKRFITCHSYVQSEISMLMHVADSMGFRINTFTHILEGYKVAAEMARHGAAGSTFSDWWAYKFEVNDAIPYNGALMHEKGVLTAFNSDDAEMGRRLNQEAAKAVKYGGMSQEEALKFVTLNPAKMLHLDDRIGSVEVGKDADLVLWSANPLSIYARAEKTLIEGIPYYDVERDQTMRKAVAQERTRILAKMQAAVKAGAKSEKPKVKEHLLYHCDTLEE